MVITQAVIERIGVRPREHEEGQITKMIEQYTRQIPSGFYLSLAADSIGPSPLSRLNGRDRDAMLIGWWVSVFMMMGRYDKIVGLQGSD
jgi:hypothetical protein